MDGRAVVEGRARMRAAPHRGLRCPVGRPTVLGAAFSARESRPRAVPALEASTDLSNLGARMRSCALHPARPGTSSSSTHRPATTAATRRTMTPCREPWCLPARLWRAPGARESRFLVTPPVCTSPSLDSTIPWIRDHSTTSGRSANVEFQPLPADCPPCGLCGVRACRRVSVRGASVTLEPGANLPRTVQRLNPQRAASRRCRSRCRRHCRPG